MRPEYPAIHAYVIPNGGARAHREVTLGKTIDAWDRHQIIYLREEPQDSQLFVNANALSIDVRAEQQWLKDGVAEIHFGRKNEGLIYVITIEEWLLYHWYGAHGAGQQAYVNIDHFVLTERWYTTTHTKREVHLNPLPPVSTWKNIEMPTTPPKRRGKQRPLL